MLRLPSQKQLFTLSAKHHGRGSVLFAWHPQGNFLATCGQNRIVNIFNRQGEELAEIPLEGTGCAPPHTPPQPGGLPF